MLQIDHHDPENLFFACGNQNIVIIHWILFVFWLDISLTLHAFSCTKLEYGF